MPAPLIEAYDAYYLAGKCAVVVCPTFADYTAPTNAELSAGLNVTRQTMAIDGWAPEAGQLDRPDYATDFKSTINGPREVKDSALTVYAKQSGADLRQTLTLGYVGYVVLMPGGWTTGYKMDVFPVLVRSRPKQYSPSDPFVIQYQFSVRQPPAEDISIPS